MSTHASPRAAYPLIIWTLQRTGGTNLTNELKQRLHVEHVHHEPFNKPRIYGVVTKAWIASEDPMALRTSVTEICHRHEVIKHCVEMVPLDVSLTLAECASLAGYRHLLLFRREPLRRILSKEYAHRTKVWGPREISQAENDAIAFDTPLDVPQLLKDETRCIEWMNRVWTLLHALNASVAAVAYEDLYGLDVALAASTVARMLDFLGIPEGPEADGAMLASLRKSGDQNTRDRHAYFQGQEALRDALVNLPQLECAR